MVITFIIFFFRSFELWYIPRHQVPIQLYAYTYWLILYYKSDHLIKLCVVDGRHNTLEQVRNRFVRTYYLM